MSSFEDRRAIYISLNKNDKDTNKAFVKRQWLVKIQNHIEAALS